MSDLELELTQMAYGGDAIGRTPDGQVVFVPYGITGERVSVQMRDVRRGMPRAEIKQVLRPVPERVSPRCPHFRDCGGCHYQHILSEAQPGLKQKILSDQLKRLAGVSDPPVQPTVASPIAWNYRNTAQFHLSPSGKLGFQRAQSHSVVEIQECHLLEQPLLDLWSQLSLDAESGIQRVELRLGMNDELLVMLESDSAEAPEAELDLPLSLVHISPAGTIVMAGEDGLWMSVLDNPFWVSAGSFFQVNTAQAERMVQQVLAWLPGDMHATLFDLYCGVGLFSLFLAPRYEHVVGVELSESACNDYALNLDRFEHVDLYQAAVEHVLPTLKGTPSAVVVDPPRSGLAPQALAALMNLKPTRLVYVSCDPATLSRDARTILAAGYQLEQVIPFDLFPQTFHIESMSLFTRE